VRVDVTQCRGDGNGNFGVVTALTYRVHPLVQTVYVTATWPGLGHLREVFEAWQQSAPHTDSRLTSQLEIQREEILLLGVLAAGSQAKVAELLAPLLSIGNPEVSMTDAGWAETYAGFQIPIDHEPAN
jgi:FAD/FMN-containing dehydrogenase